MENTQIDNKVRIYKIIFVLLLIAFIVTAVLIVNKYIKEKSIEEEAFNVVEQFKQTETIKDEEGLSLISYKGYRVIGIINIPKIDIEYPILEKNTNETMKYSIGRYFGGSINSFGNVSLAGHNNYSGTMFGKTKYLEKGDIIELTDLNNVTIQYEVYDIFTTDPNDVSVLETTDDSIREVTLITCKNGREQRLIVKAKEIK